jgi:polyferredoxin
MNKRRKNILPDKVSVWKRNKSNFILIHLLFVGIVGKSYYEMRVAPHAAYFK